MIRDRPQDGHPGLPLGRIVSEYVGAGLDALDVNVTSLVPQEVKDVVDSITLDQAMLGFVNIGTPTASNWTSKFVEVAVSSAHAPWSPFESFQISNVQLHFVYDSGVDADPTNVTPAATQVEFNADLTVGTNVIQAGFTYQSSTSSWTITLKAGQTIHLVDLILSGIQSVGLEIPSEIVDKIEEILVIDTNSFYISYSPGDATNPKQIAFSNDGLVSLFGIGVTNISVFCSKEGGGPWSYTVSLALPSPCEPLSVFGNIPGLGGIRVVDGKFAFFKGQPSTDVIGNGVLPPGMNLSSIILSGKIKFGNDPGSFMALIKSIVKLDEIDIAILPGVVSIAIPAASLGLNLMDVFKVLSFNFDIFIGGFGLGATVELKADWLSKTPVQGQFLLVIMADGALGASVALHNITNPFGLPGIKLVEASFSLVWLPELFEPQSLSASATIEVSEHGADAIRGSFALSLDEVNPNGDYFRLYIENLTLVNLINTLTNGSCPSELNVADLGFKKLAIDLEPAGDKFTFNADFFLFSLEGKCAAEVQISTGISFAVNTNVVNIIGLVKLHAYKNDNMGAFMYLDSTIKDIVSGDFKAPKWLGVTSKDDPNLKGAIFAFSSTCVFLGAELDMYGIIGTTGLILTVASSNGLTLPGVSFHVEDTFNITIKSQHISAGTTFHFDLSLHLPDINILGIPLGSFDGTVVQLDDKLQLTVKYAEKDWHNDDVEFFVMVAAEVLGLRIKEQLDLDITITKLEQLPGAIERFVVDKVVDYLEDKIAGPIIALGKEIYKAANEAVAALVDGFNVLGSDIISLLSDAGHEIEAISDALKNTLLYTIDEVATALSDFGHDVNDIASIVGNVFEAAPQEVLSALTSAGFTIEHAVDAVFDEAGGELSKDFNLVGNSVAGFALDAGEVIGHFLTGNVAGFVDNTISDAGQFFDGVGDDISNFFSGGDCVIL